MNQETLATLEQRLAQQHARDDEKTAKKLEYMSKRYTTYMAVTNNPVAAALMVVADQLWDIDGTIGNS